MDPKFWLDRWQEQKINFHEGAPNTLLTPHLPALNLAPGARIFVPLCGKAQDMHYLAAQGFEVIGAELSPLAVEQFFAEAGLTPSITQAGPLTRHSAAGITIYLGDIFALTPAELGPIAAIYDRAALVALPPDLRARYAGHLITLTATAPQLLITFAYDQTQQPGPPFSVDEAAIHALYSKAYRLTCLETRAVPLKAITAEESAFLLTQA